MSGAFTYAIADLHGRYDLLQKAYDAISGHSAGKPITILHLGDYVDRGPQSREVIEWLMDDAALPPWVRRVCLQGNHEAMMLETIRAPLHPEWWIGNGGGQTLISYGHEPRGVYNPGVVPTTHLDWIASRPLFHVDEHRLFVHAGVRLGAPLNEQPDEILQWMIWPTGAEDDYRGLHIVHGHEQFADGPKRFAGRTDLDTFAWYTGRLVIGVFDNARPGGPVDFLEVIGSPASSFRPTPSEQAHG